MAKAKTEKKTVAQTTVAQAFALDVKQSHSMRKALDSQGFDAFALHGFDKLSRGYAAQGIALAAKRQETVKRCKSLRLLVCNGVGNWIRVDESTGDYMRNGKLSVRDCTAEQAVFGNINVLTELYGKAVQVMTEAEAEKLYDSVKEQTTRTVGTGKTAQKLTGRVILSGLKGDTSLDVLTWKANGKLTFANCESKRNARNASHIYVTEKTTEAKK